MLPGSKLPVPSDRLTSELPAVKDCKADAVHLCIYMYVCMYICVYIYIYIYRGYETASWKVRTQAGYKVSRGFTIGHLWNYRLLGVSFMFLENSCFHGNIPVRSPVVYTDFDARPTPVPLLQPSHPLLFSPHPHPQSLYRVSNFRYLRSWQSSVRSTINRQWKVTSLILRLIRRCILSLLSFLVHRIRGKGGVDRWKFGRFNRNAWNLLYFGWDVFFIKYYERNEKRFFIVSSSYLCLFFLNIKFLDRNRSGSWIFIGAVVS